MPIQELTQAGLARRLKRHVLKEPQLFFATTTPGFEGVLQEEIAALPGAEVVETTTGGVEFRGPLECVYHGASRLACANRLIMRIAAFTVRSYPELYNKVRRTPIEWYTGFASRIAVEATATSSRLHHTGNIENSVFEACCDRLGPLGIVPVRDDAAPLRFMIRLSDDCCTLSIDASGPLLYKRGYRLDTAHAPLRESIAAGLLKLSNWRNYRIIADPLCGSGTFIIEAALLALGRSVGEGRTCAFASWPCFNENLWNRIRKEPPTMRAGLAQLPKLVGSDISGRAVEAALANATRAGVADCTVFSVADCLEFNGAGDGPGLIIANLPYGKRAAALGVPQEAFFGALGARLRSACPGWHWGFVTDDRRFARRAGLRESGCLPFSNGGLDVYFVTGIVS